MNDGPQRVRPEASLPWWAIVSIAILAIASVIFGPVLLVGLDCNVLAPNSCAQHRTKALSDTRAALIQFWLAVGAGGTLYVTWRNSVQTARDAEQTRQNTQRAHEQAVKHAAEMRALTRAAQLSDNFVKAVEQLGGRNGTAHVGGIYGLDRVLRATKEGAGDYWAVMDVLCSFVRQRFAVKRPPSSQPVRPEPAPEDLQAALDVLARRWVTPDHDPPSRETEKNSPVDLHGSNLANTWMADGHFERGFFGDCDLRGTDLRNSSFIYADFKGAVFDKAALARVRAVMERRLALRRTEFRHS